MPFGQGFKDMVRRLFLNQLLSRYSSTVFLQHPVREINLNIDNCNVHLLNNSKQLEVLITGSKSILKLHNILNDLENLFFFYLGSFPVLELLQENGKSVDIDNRVRKYKTSKQFLKNNLVLCDITSETITEDVIVKLRKINQLPIYSLQYLISETYDHVIVNHKMTLLLHVIDGLYDDSRKQMDKQKIREKYQASRNGKIGDYMAAVYWMCSNYFFHYHRKFGCDIMPLLKVTQYEFLERLSDTRNFYSHFLKENQKELKIKRGTDFVIYFEIVCYMIRLAIIDRIGTKVDEENIKEFYYTVHDWILAIVYDRNDPIKSKTYRMARAWDEFREFIEKLESEQK